MRWRRWFYGLLAMLVLGVLVSGCVTPSQTLVIGEDGLAAVSFRLKGEKAEVGQELPLLTWQLQQLVPQLGTEYTFRSETVTEDGLEYLINAWTSRERIPVTSLRGASWQKVGDGYRFRLVVEALLTEVSEKQRDEVVMDITVTMPRLISIANTLDVKDNTARWVITRGNLTAPLVLQALTE